MPTLAGAGRLPRPGAHHAIEPYQSTLCFRIEAKHNIEIVQTKNRRLAAAGTLLADADACRADARGRLGFHDRPYPQADYLSALLDAALAVDAGGIARQWEDKRTLPEAIDRARTRAIASRKEQLETH